MTLLRIYLNLVKQQNVSSFLKLGSANNLSCSLCRTVSTRAKNGPKLLVNERINLPAALQCRPISSVEEKPVSTDERRSLFTRMISKIPFLNVNKSKLAVAGYMLYESIADKISYADFFEEFSLPDTFYSWFAVTELHIWLLTVRCMAEGDDGRFVRNKMVQALWTDVGLRVKKIGAGNPSEMRRQVQELSEQFQAALIAYDEGLQSDDTVLAGALWRRMYQQNDVDPEHLEALIKYVRRQVRLLDHESRTDLFSRKFQQWGLCATK